MTLDGIGEEDNFEYGGGGGGGGHYAWSCPQSFSYDVPFRASI